MGGVRKEGSEGLECHQRTSYGQECVEVSYPCARTITRFSRSYEFHLLPTLTYLGLKSLLLLL
uniref:Uncharacterized protein n=1 Tax=Arundo donax TaxID=35708 RepID=A0A0A8Y6M2_ARUDO